MKSVRMSGVSGRVAGVVSVLGVMGALLIGAAPAQAASAPYPVQSVSVDAGDGMATVSWTMPPNGTPPLTGFIVYKAYIPRGLTLDRFTGFPIVVCETDMARRACDVSGLINQSPYAFEVVAVNGENPNDPLKSTPVRSGIVIPRSSTYQVWTVAQIGLAGERVTTYVANAPANTDISFAVAGVQKSVVKSDATGSVRTTLPLPAGQFGPIAITATASGKMVRTSIQVVKTVVTTSKKQGKTTVTFSVSNASPCVDCQIDVSFGDKPMEYADIRANGKAVVTMTATRPGKVSYTVNLRENRLALGFPDSIQELASGKVTIT